MLISHLLCILQFCDLLQSMVEGTDFLEKLENARAALPQNMSGIFLMTGSIRIYYYVVIFEGHMVEITLLKDIK